MFFTYRDRRIRFREIHAYPKKSALPAYSEKMLGTVIDESGK